MDSGTTLYDDCASRNPVRLQCLRPRGAGSRRRFGRLERYWRWWARRECRRRRFAGCGRLVWNRRRRRVEYVGYGRLRRRRRWIVGAAGGGTSSGGRGTFDAGQDIAPPPHDGSTDAGPRDAGAGNCAGYAIYFDGATYAALSRPVQDDFTIEAWIRTS